MSTTRQPWCLQVQIVHFWVEGENITSTVKILPSERLIDDSPFGTQVVLRLQEDKHCRGQHTPIQS